MDIKKFKIKPKVRKQDLIDAGAVNRPDLSATALYISKYIPVKNAEIEIRLKFDKLKDWVSDNRECIRVINSETGDPWAAFYRYRNIPDIAPKEIKDFYGEYNSFLTSLKFLEEMTKV